MQHFKDCCSSAKHKVSCHLLFPITHPILWSTTLLCSVISSKPVSINALRFEFCILSFTSSHLTFCFFLTESAEKDDDYVVLCHHWDRRVLLSLQLLLIKSSNRWDISFDLCKLFICTLEHSNSYFHVFLSLPSDAEIFKEKPFLWRCPVFVLPVIIILYNKV